LKTFYLHDIFDANPEDYMRAVAAMFVFIFLMASAVPVSFGDVRCPSCGKCASCANTVTDAAKAGDPVGNGALRKMGRGFANAFGWPTEIFNQMSKANSTGGPLAAMSWGLASGIGMATVRCLVGFYEFATFAIPIPPNYEPILDDPELCFKDEAF